jgi:hypothetical protein
LIPCHTEVHVEPEVHDDVPRADAVRPVELLFEQPDRGRTHFVAGYKERWPVNRMDCQGHPVPERGGAYPPPLAGMGQLALELDVAEVELKHGETVVGAEADGVDDA